MCGFAGVIAWDDRYRVDRDALRRMSARIAHRGPDGEGLHLNHEQEVTPARPQVGLVHRRLAIIDPDPRANQPFTDDRGRWIVFNGEIYNFRELRAELKQLRPDYAWRTDCDTEVLLAAYAAWGEKCLERLNGMFAFAVWDGPAGALFLARDRMGQKPLYYSRTDGVFAFGSEVSVLKCLPWFNHEIDGWGLDHYLSYGYTLAPTTIYYGTAQVAPAHWLRAMPDAPPSITSYFDPNSGWDLREQTATGGLAAKTRHLLTQAVQRQLVADVPIGCFLSGGIDSSVIALLMTSAVNPGQPVRTFCIGFDDARYDETAFADQVARHLNTEHHRFVVRPNAVESLPQLCEVFGEPFADSSAIPTHYLARETRGHVKVALSGDGGDELFGGYDRYRATRLAERLRALPLLRDRRAARLFQRLPGTHPKSRAARIKRFAATLHLEADERYDSYMRLFDDVAIDELFGVRSLPVAASDAKRTPSGRDVVEKAIAVDRRLYLPNDVLTKVDRASMSHALEVRSPFMDHELVQFAAGLTTDQLLKGGPKRMLREAFAADLPAWVFRRRKMGFAVPIGEWFRGNLRPMLHDHLFASDSFAAHHFQTKTVRRLVDEHESGRADHAQRLYALLMLELWWRGDGKN